MTDEEALKAWPSLPEKMRERNERKWDNLDLPEEEINYRRRQVVGMYQRTQTPHPDDPSRSLAGGPQPGAGRPKKKRVAQMIAEKAQSPDGAKKIIDRLWEKLDSDDERVGLRAIETIGRFEAKEEELQQKEQELEDKPKDQLIAGLSEILRRLEKKGELATLGLKRPDFVEGTAEDVTITQDVDDRGRSAGAE